MKFFYIAAAVIAAGLLATPTSGQQEQRDSQPRQSRQDAQTRPAGGQDAERSFEQMSRQRQRQVRREARQRLQTEGEIVDVQFKQYQGFGEPNAVATVRRDNGQEIDVDLGPVSNLRDQGRRMRRGQRVSVEGEPGRLNGAPILVADRLVGDGQVTNIDPDMRRRGPRQNARDGRRQQRQGGRDMGRLEGRQVAVVGDVRSTRTVGLRDSDAEHMLVVLSTSQGRTVTVDLGPVEQVEDEINQGDTLAAVGTLRGLSGDRRVIVADRLGVLRQIDRDVGVPQQLRRGDDGESREGV